MGNRQLKWWHNLGTYGKPRTVCIGDYITFAGGEKTTDCVPMDDCVTFAGGEKTTDCVYIQMIVLPLQMGRKPPTVCIGDFITFTGGEKATNCVYR